MRGKSMDYLLNIVLQRVDIFLLILVRVTALLVIVPFFSQQNIPTYVKIGFSAFISMLFLSAIPDLTIEYENTVISYITVVVKEFLVGIVIGFSMYLCFTAFYIAGQIVDFQIGFGMTNVLDPFSQIQVPITGNLYYFVATMILVITNGHHRIIEALYSSFQQIPLGGFKWGEKTFELLLQYSSTAFSTGFKIAIPIVLTMFVLDVALGFLTRVAPQINIFVVGYIIKIILGLMALYIMLPSFISLTDNVFHLMSKQVQRLFEVIK